MNAILMALTFYSYEIEIPGSNSAPFRNLKIYRQEWERTMENWSGKEAPAPFPDFYRDIPEECFVHLESPLASNELDAVLIRAGVEYQKRVTERVEVYWLYPEAIQGSSEFKPTGAMVVSES